MSRIGTASFNVSHLPGVSALLPYFCRRGETFEDGADDVSVEGWTIQLVPLVLRSVQAAEEPPDVLFATLVHVSKAIGDHVVADFLECDLHRFRLVIRETNKSVMRVLRAFCRHKHLPSAPIPFMWRGRPVGNRRFGHVSLSPPRIILTATDRFAVYFGDDRLSSLASMASDNELLKAIASTLENIENALGGYLADVDDTLKDILRHVEFIAEALEYLVERFPPDEE